jgi:hypothetical protein
VHSSKIIAMSEFSTALDAHRLLGGEQQLVAVDRRGEAHAFLADLAHLAQAEHLEAAGVGQDGLVPAVERMQSAELASITGQPRPQPQMEGVAQDDLRAHGRRARAGTSP